MEWKLCAAIVATLLAATPTYAEMSWAEKCGYMGKIAGKVMTNHQNRKPLEDSLQAYDDIADPEFKAILRRIVIEAYETPRYNTQKHQSNAIRDYSDETLLSCLKAE